MKKKFSIIAAVDQKNGLGKEGAIPWVLPSDMKHFKAVTLASAEDGKVNAVIMGRKTWESLPDKWRPLPGRLNVVLTRDKKYPLPCGVLKFHALEEAINSLCGADNVHKVGHVFVIGGANVYAQAVLHPLCQKVYLTVIEKDFDCDTFFPNIRTPFMETKRSGVQTEADVNYFFVLYER